MSKNKPTTRHARKTRPGPTPRDPSTLLSGRINIGLTPENFERIIGVAYAVNLSVSEIMNYLVDEYLDVADFPTDKKPI